jgi:hypothetical protein
MSIRIHNLAKNIGIIRWNGYMRSPEIGVTHLFVRNHATRVDAVSGAIADSPQTHFPSGWKGFLPLHFQDLRPILRLGISETGWAGVNAVFFPDVKSAAIVAFAGRSCGDS